MQLEEYHYQSIKELIFRYHPVGADTLAQLYSIAEIQILSKNETLLPVGKTAKHIHFLHKGAVIAYFLNPEGNKYNKNIFLEGNLVGSTVSYLTGTPSQFGLEAIEHCEIIRFNYEKYRKLIFGNEDFKSFYIAYLEKNWIIEKEKREIDIVMKDADLRYMELTEQHPGIDERIPLKHIASHLGITPTQLSRIRNNIKK